MFPECVCHISGARYGSRSRTEVVPGATELTVATGVGEPRSKILFADLTGDGKAEYTVQYYGGFAKAYRNTGNIADAASQ